MGSEMCIRDRMKFPLQGFAQNQVWCQIVQLAGVIVAWMQAIALAGHDARRWEPKRFRARLFEIPATIVRRCRHKILHSRLIAFEGVARV